MLRFRGHAWVEDAGLVGPLVYCGHCGHALRSGQGLLLLLERRFGPSCVLVREDLLDVEIVRACRCVVRDSEVTCRAVELLSSFGISRTMAACFVSLLLCVIAATPTPASCSLSLVALPCKAIRPLPRLTVSRVALAVPNLASILLHQSARAYRQIRLATMHFSILTVIDYLVMRVNLRRDSRPGALRHFPASFLRSGR